MNKANVKVVITGKQYGKWSFRPSFKRKKQFRNWVIVIEKQKCRINLKKQVYTGTSVLNLSLI